MGMMSLTDAGRPIFILSHKEKERLLLLVIDPTFVEDVKLPTKKVVN
jgi:hypothetical protein